MPPKKGARAKKANNKQPLNHKKMTKEQEEVITNAVDTGFRDVDRTPAEPALDPGHLKDWKRPDFPADDASQQQLIDVFKKKLMLVRNAAIKEIKQNATETEEELLKRKKTSENPVAILFADPNQPFPISFQAQDIVRNYLYMLDTIRDLGSSSTEEKKTKKWKWASDMAIVRRDDGWYWLVDNLQLQLPGKEHDRKEQVKQILQNVLREPLELIATG
jgi:hypothetical protein